MFEFSYIYLNYRLLPKGVDAVTESLLSRDGA